MPPLHRICSSGKRVPQQVPTSFEMSVIQNVLMFPFKMLSDCEGSARIFPNKTVILWRHHWWLIYNFPYFHLSRKYCHDTNSPVFSVCLCCNLKVFPLSDIQLQNKITHVFPLILTDSQQYLFSGQIKEDIQLYTLQWILGIIIPLIYRISGPKYKHPT